MSSMRVLSQCPACTRRFFDAATSLNAPSRIAKLASNDKALQLWRRKQFSASTSRPIGRAIIPKPKQKSQSTLNVAMRQAQEKMQREGTSMLPEDLGLMPQTFVRPTTSERWEWSMIKYWARRRFSELREYLFTRFYFHRKLKVNYDYKQVAGIAQDLHQRMYKAFAEGELSPLTGRLASGLEQSLKRRIATRSPGEVYEWKIVRRIGRSQRVSYRTMPLPADPVSQTGMDNNGLHQAIVRIQTVQSMQKSLSKPTRVDGVLRRTVTAVEGGSSEKECTEFVVLNRRIINGRIGDWKLWGFTQESTSKSVAQEIQVAKPVV